MARIATYERYWNMYAKSNRTPRDQDHLAKHLQVKRALVSHYPPQSFEDMLAKLKNEYKNYSAGAASHGDIQICLGDAFAEVIVSTAKAKYGKVLDMKALKTLMIHSCPGIFDVGVDPVEAINQWNRWARDGISIMAADGADGFQLRLEYHMTEDFDVAQETIKDLARAQASAIVTKVVEDQVVGLHAMQASMCEDGKIKAFDRGGFNMVDSSNFCDLIILDPILSRSKIMLDVEKTYERMMQKVTEKCRLQTVMVGNPGTGKSTLINCYLQEHVFSSGISRTGAGVTFQLDVKIHKGNKYMDTPGLSDLKLRQQAALAIGEALKSGGNFRLLFVITTETGRIKPDDLTTMKLVIDATQGQIDEDDFGVLVNKCSRKWLSKLAPEGLQTWADAFNDTLKDKGIPTSSKIHFVQSLDELEGEDDVLVPLREVDNAFIENLPIVHLNSDFVDDVNYESFDDLQRQIELDAEEKKRLVEEAKQANDQATAASEAAQAAEEQQKVLAEQAKKAEGEAKTAEEKAKVAEENQKKIAAQAKEAEEKRAAAVEAQRAVEKIAAADKAAAAARLQKVQEEYEARQRELERKAALIAQEAEKKTAADKAAADARMKELEAKMVAAEKARLAAEEKARKEAAEAEARRLKEAAEAKARRLAAEEKNRKQEEARLAAEEKTRKEAAQAQARILAAQAKALKEAAAEEAAAAEARHKRAVQIQREHAEQIERERMDFIIGVKSVARDSASVPGEFLDWDANGGQGGAYVYLAPIYGNKYQACHGFELIMSDGVKNDLPEHSTNDLAKGAGGKYRYIKPVFQGYGGKLVKKVWWSEHTDRGPYCTEDINKGRGGRYLYLNWSY